ncbi:major facilitator superfamily domain-containing protein [Fusarium acuminatum]|jgi:solute carrier family 45 protein 1/2/4|uniref:Major facilitator superfamily domain-containing protein n=1 Tax=Fusarium acuminatum TaxID=5515 RepID=A0ABZ2WX18_9HYPO
MGVPSERTGGDGSSSNPRRTGGSQSIARVANPQGRDEQSPLLSNNADADNIHGEEDDSQTTKSIWYMLLLTISIGGLQIAWSVELSNGSPYLLSLGLSKSLMALVWIAGPLTGTLVQPYVGMLSDNCRLPMGKRKPFMIGGSIATILSLLFLAWAKEIVAGASNILGFDPLSQGVKTTTIVVAVIGVYVLDFAINTVQASIRAFIVDCAPAHQQESANAMASRITGFGNIVGYIAGYVDLTRHLGFLGKTQFQILCAIACVALASTVFVSTAIIKERDPRLDGPASKESHSVFSFFFTIFKSIKRLPPQIKRVCEVQFCAWVGFFPLLFYTSSYIGEIYVEPYLEANPHMPPEQLNKLYEQATRIGTFALLINSVVSLLTNVFLPFFIAPTYDSQPAIGAPGESPAAGYYDEDEDEKPSWLDRLAIPGLTLKRAWFLSLLLFAGCMFATLFVRTVKAATVLVGLVGVTWAMTLWAPWAIISAEISQRDAQIRAQKIRQAAARANNNGVADEEEEEIDQAGVILGIHNMAIAAPQIIATVGSSIIFKLWQKPRGTPGDHSISIVFALGGICVLVASFFVAKIKDESTTPPDAVADAEQGQSGTGADPARRPLNRRKSTKEQLPRATQARAGLIRHKSFGGAEMH